MFDNTITFIIVLLVVLFVVIMKKIKSKKSTALRTWKAGINEKPPRTSLGGKALACVWIPF